MGLFWSFTSALLWSTTFVAARHLLSQGQTDPVTLSVVRFLLGGLLLLGFGLITHRRQVLAVTWRDLGAAAALGLFGVLGMSLLLFYGQECTTAVNASIIIQLSPIFIALLGWAVGDEKLRPLALVGILLAFVGSLLVGGIVTPTGVHVDVASLKGSLLVLGSAACWAVYSVFGKRFVRRLGGYAATTWCMLAGAVLLLLWWLLVPGEHRAPEEPSAWWLVLYIAVFPTAVAFFAWYEAMRTLDMALLNVMQYLSTAFTIPLAWLLLGERLTWLPWVGVATIAAGVALVGLPHKRRSPGNAAPAHHHEP